MKKSSVVAVPVVSRRAFVLTAVLGASACGGGGSGSAAAPAPSPLPPTGGTTPPAQPPTLPPPPPPVLPPAPPPSPVPPLGALPTLTLAAVGAGNHPWAVGHVFRDGDVPNGTTLANLQLTPVSTWPSGAVRFGIVAGVSALSTGLNSIPLAAGPAPSGESITLETLRAAMAQPVSVTVSGIGAASWSGEDWLAPFAVWATGQVMSSWVYRKPVGGDAHLVAWLEVRMWSNGAVEVLPWIENGYLFVPGGRSVNATYAFIMGGTMRETLTIDLPHHCRTPLLSGTKLSHWLGSDPGLTVKHDAAYMMATEMVPTYGAVTAPGDYPVSRLPATFTPLQQGGYASAMGSAGASEDIGLLPDWDAAYLTSNAPSVWAGLQRNAYSAGRYGIYWRDEVTNRPIRFSRHPHLVLSSPAIASTGNSQTGTFAVQGSGTLPAGWTNSHHPAVGYMAALVTGRYFHVETTQFAGTIPYLVNTSAPTHRDGSKGLIRSYWGANMTRGAAWGLRSLVNALAITPDGDPLKGEFLASWSANLNYYYDRYVGRPHNPQGFITPFSDQDGAGVWIAQWWMDDFFTAMTGYARALCISTMPGDEAKLAAFFDWKARSIVGRTGTEAPSEFLYRDLAQYFGPYAPSDSVDWNGGTGPWFANWGQIWAASNSYQSHGGPKEIGTGSLRGDNGVSNASYFANAVPALAYAVRFNVPGALEGWRRVTSAPNWGSYATDSAGWPVFNIRPAVMPM